MAPFEVDGFGANNRFEKGSISPFLARILMEHIGMKKSLDSQLHFEPNNFTRILCL